MGERELETGLQELTDVRPLDVVLLLNLGDSQDLSRARKHQGKLLFMCTLHLSSPASTHVDRSKPGSVPGSEVLVKSLDGTNSGKLSELLVHVVGSRSRVVSEPDTKVLDLEGTLLVDLKEQGVSKCTLAKTNFAIPSFS